MKFETAAVHAGEEPLTQTGKFGDVAMPIHLSSTFARKVPTEPTEGFEYSRTGNPTRLALERKLAAIESAKFALAFSSGSAAETTILLSLLRTGDTILASDDLYGGSRRLLVNMSSNFGLRLLFSDFTSPDKVKGAMREKPKMVWYETPSNPLMKIIDIALISEMCSEAGALSVVDNTFATPYFQMPLGMGADIVLHSTTKYLNGHSDSVGGALITDNDDLHEKLKFYQNAGGAILSPFDSYLTLRGIKTLHARMPIHERNASSIASFLSGHRMVKKMYYPGLDSHPGHAIAKKQMRGFGGMLSFVMDSDQAAVSRFLGSLKVFYLAESLGGVESLIEVPALMTHASVPENERNKLGISNSLIRVSAGIESETDLISDLKDALESVAD
ncbi:MAG: PLP-dependent aspartate aminotransferase family protein [Candidatus Thermoplasmatota archaeon]|jgi:cystathionine gamma-lyase|nr:PLP-dependent aspartate aminotransferase family protein [Candidatus Thermoplasmatota archaeon]